MRKYRKKQLKKKLSLQFKFILLPFFLILLVSFGFAYWLSLRTPNLHEKPLVTVLPPEFKQTLGAKTKINLPKETPIKTPIFLYHYVEYVHDDPGRQKLNIPPNVLTAQIETLKNDGYTFITPDDLANAISAKKELPDKTIILSFDDGYKDFYNYVLPILQAENVKAVFYIIPDFLNQSLFLSTTQLEEIAKSPLIEIGAHTMDHVWLKGQTQKTDEYQIAQSRIFLQNLLHLPINSFAYPYGAFDQQAIDAVTKAGFSNAVSTIPGIMQTTQNKYFLYRLRPGYRTGETLLKFLTQKTFAQY